MIELVGKENRIKKQYRRVSEEERKTYYRDYTREYRKNKNFYWARVQRGMLGRYIDEKLLFNKNDLDYIKSINLHLN